MLEELDHRRAVEAAQRNPADARHPPQIGECRGEWMEPIEIGVAVGADDGEVGEIGDYHPSEKLQGSLVDPVHVVEDDGERSCDTEQGDDCVDDHRVAGVGIDDEVGVRRREASCH